MKTKNVFPFGIFVDLGGCKNQIAGNGKITQRSMAKKKKKYSRKRHRLENQLQQKKMKGRKGHTIASVVTCDLKCWCTTQSFFFSTDAT